MLSHEFGIINNLQPSQDYSEYCPRKYNCIYINDDYLMPLMKTLRIMPTYFHNLNSSNYGLDYYGVTLIPPNSLAFFQETLLNASKKHGTEELDQLICLISLALGSKKYIIHFGI